MKKILLLTVLIAMLPVLFSCADKDVPEESDSRSISSELTNPPETEQNNPVDEGYTLARDFTADEISDLRDKMIGGGYVPTERLSIGYTLSRTENALRDPGNVAHSFEELCDIVDYNSFYEVKEFEVLLAFENNYTSAQTLANDIYWNAALVTEYCAINAEFVSKDRIKIALFYYDYATLRSTSDHKNTKILGYGVEVKDKRAEDFDDFAYLKSENVLTVYNSKQLWYGLERGYRVIPIEGSPAETCLNAAKSILRNICSESMTDEQKILNIFLYGAENIVYDSKGEDDAATLPAGAKKNNAALIECDAAASMIDSFFLDGALLSGHAVCHGHAQYFNVLLNIEGIESHRYVARSYQFGDTRNVLTIDGTYYVHAFNYVALSGRYYICDLTYTFAGRTRNGYKQEQSLFRDLGYMISETAHRNVYSSFRLKYSGKYSAQDTIDYYSYPVEFEGNTLSAYIDSREAAQSYARYLVAAANARDDISSGDIAAFEVKFSSPLLIPIFNLELDSLCAYTYYPYSNVGYIFKP